MIDLNGMKKVEEYIRRHCTADDFTLWIDQTHNLQVRFAQNAITQHMIGDNTWIRLQVAYDNKTGSASSNQTDENSLTELISTAQSIARINQPDPEFVPSAGSEPLPDVDNFSPVTAALTVEDTVNGISKCVSNADKKSAFVSGISQKQISNSLIMTRNGFWADESNTTFSHSMTMKKGDVETKVSRSVQDYDDFKMENEIIDLNRQFDSLKTPVPMPTGKYAVIMRPAAVLNWLYYLIWTMDLRNSDEGLTPFTDQIGKKFMGADFSLRSKLKEPGVVATKYIMDGVVARDIDWVDKGVLKNMAVSRYYAREKGIKPARVYNIIVEGGDATEEEMMKKAGRGFILNRLWYIRPVDRKTGEMTGLTRDGVLYFEDGKIKNSANNFRWNDVLHDLTRRISALGESVTQEYYAKIPSLLIEDFNFVDVTTF